MDSVFDRVLNTFLQRFAVDGYSFASCLVLLPWFFLQFLYFSTFQIGAKVSKYANTSKSHNIQFDKDFKDINSFMTKVPIIQKPVHWFAVNINGLASVW